MVIVALLRLTGSQPAAWEGGAVHPISWKAAYRRDGEAGLVNRKTIPKNPANRTVPEIVEKVLQQATIGDRGCGPCRHRHLLSNGRARIQLPTLASKSGNRFRLKRAGAPVLLCTKHGYPR